MPVTIRKPYDAYNGKRYASSISFLDENGDPSVGLTEQCHKDLCDIEKILDRYDRTGLITHVNKAKANYGDFTLVNEYQESLNLVLEAQDAFDDLPSAIRKRFGNDPGAFFEFVTNPDNGGELVKMGLANAPEVVAPEIVPETPPA